MRFIITLERRKSIEHDEAKKSLTVTSDHEKADLLTGFPYLRGDSHFVRPVQETRDVNDWDCFAGTSIRIVVSMEVCWCDRKDEGEKGRGERRTDEQGVAICTSER